MLKSVKYIILYLMIQSNVMSNLTNHDFCMKNVKKNKCSENFSFECKPDKCSIGKRACQYFNSLVFGSNLRRNNAQDMKKFNEFKRLIKNCAKTEHEHDWKTTDFCLNRVKCFSYFF